MITNLRWFNGKLQWRDENNDVDCYWADVPTVTEEPKKSLQCLLNEKYHQGLSWNEIAQAARDYIANELRV